MHGGTIEATSEGRGKGAKFRVTLPLAGTLQEVSSMGEPVRRHPHIFDAAALAGLHPLPVPAVDHDPDSLGLVRAILEAGGARGLTSLPGPTAHASVESISPGPPHCRLRIA